MLLSLVVCVWCDWRQFIKCRLCPHQSPVLMLSWELGTVLRSVMKVNERGRSRPGFAHSCVGRTNCRVEVKSCCQEEAYKVSKCAFGEYLVLACFFERRMLMVSCHSRRQTCCAPSRVGVLYEVHVGRCLRVGPLRCCLKPFPSMFSVRSFSTGELDCSRDDEIRYTRAFHSAPSSKSVQLS